MRKLVLPIAIGLMALGVAAYAHGPGSDWGRGGYGMGPGMMGPGMMGPGMMGGYGPYENPEYGPRREEGVSIDQAKEIAEKYTVKYLPGFTVERVLPYTGMRHTMFGVELKGPKGETRYLHVNPWGGVMPFTGGPWAGQ